MKKEDHTARKTYGPDNGYEGTAPPERLTAE